MKIQSVQYGWFCSPDAFPKDRKVSLTELACLPLVEQTECSGLSALPSGPFTSLGIETQYVFDSNSVAALGGLVAAGICLALLPVKHLFNPNSVTFGKRVASIINS